MLPVRPTSLLDFRPLWIWCYATMPKIPSKPEMPSAWSSAGSPPQQTCLSLKGRRFSFPLGTREGDTCVSSQPLKQVEVGCWHGTCLSSAPSLPDLSCPALSALWSKMKLLHLISMKASKPRSLQLSRSLNVPRAWGKEEASM